MRRQQRQSAFAVAVGCCLVAVAVADGTAEKTPFDDILASLCAGRTTAPSPADARPPLLSQLAFASVHMSMERTATALYVTDADGTVLALARDTNAATLLLPTEAVEQPQRLVPHALIVTAAGCERTRGDAVDNWRALLEGFDYDAAGGAHAMHDGHGGELSESILSSAVPRLSMAADGGAAVTVSMKMMPGLFVPLLFLKCQTTNIVGWRRFDRAHWPATSAPPATFSAVVDGWMADGACTRLYACAAMPAGSESCGGFPQRCTDLDMLPWLVSRLEAHSPAGTDDGGSYGRLQVTLTVERGPRLVVHSPACEGMRLYLKDGPRRGAAVLAYAASGTVRWELPVNRSSLHAVWAYRACGGGPAAALVSRSEQLRLAPLVALHEAAQAQAAQAAAAQARRHEATATSAATSAAVRAATSTGLPTLPAVERSPHAAATAAASQQARARRRGPMLMGAALLVVVVAGLAGLGWQARRRGACSGDSMDAVAPGCAYRVTKVDEECNDSRPL